MTAYNPAIHNRRSIRLKGYDYAQKGLYFVTLCCQDRASIFGAIVNGEMILNEFGKIAKNEWLNTPSVRKNIELHEFVIMPNHIHGIIEILENVKENSEENIGQFKSPSQTVGAIVRGYKIATIKKIKDYINKNLGGNGSISWGELQFAPTYTLIHAPTYTLIHAPTYTLIHAPTYTLIHAPTYTPIHAPTYTAQEDPSKNHASTYTSTKRIINLDFKIWQRNYFERIIRDQRAYENISNYIIDNPKNWNADKLNT